MCLLTIIPPSTIAPFVPCAVDLPLNVAPCHMQAPVLSRLWNLTGKPITISNHDQKHRHGGGTFPPGEHIGCDIWVGHDSGNCLIINYADGSGEIMRVWDQDWAVHLKVRVWHTFTWCDKRRHACAGTNACHTSMLWQGRYMRTHVTHLMVSGGHMQ